MSENPSDLTNDPSDDMCFVGVGLDKTGSGFVSIHINDGNEENFINLLFGLLSGGLSEEIMSSIKDYCLEKEIDLEKIITGIESKVIEISKLPATQPVDELYIRPSQVRNDNNFF